MDDKDLPEWYQMVAGFFREVAVFSSDFYADNQGPQILKQVRYAAIRDKERMDTNACASRAAQHPLHDIGGERALPKENQGDGTERFCLSVTLYGHHSSPDGIACAYCGAPCPATTDKEGPTQPAPES